MAKLPIGRGMQEGPRAAITQNTFDDLRRFITDIRDKFAAWLPGRRGGQRLNGGINAGENLTLSSTANSTKGKIIFGTSAYDEVNNRLGIGIINPSYSAHIYNTDSTATRGLHIESTGNSSILGFRRQRANATTVASGDVLGNAFFAGYDGSAYVTGAQIRAIVSGAVSASVLPTDMVFENTVTTGVSEKLRIVSDGTIKVATGNIVLPKTSGVGIEVDPSAPTFPWLDLLGDITIRDASAGSVNPSFNIYRAPLRQFQYSVNDESYVNFHIPHDYVPGTDVFIHAHWSLAVGGVNENITWGLNVSYAKGHNQAAFIAPIAINLPLTASSTTQYQHMLTEVQVSSAGGSSGTLLDTNNLEPDGVIMCRVYLNANSGGTEPFLHYCDLHYQSTNIGTKQKAPNFYT